MEDVQVIFDAAKVKGGGENKKGNGEPFLLAQKRAHLNLVDLRSSWAYQILWAMGRKL